MILKDITLSGSAPAAHSMMMGYMHGEDIGMMGMWRLMGMDMPM